MMIRDGSINKLLMSSMERKRRYRQNYREKNREKLLAYDREYRATHREYVMRWRQYVHDHTIKISGKDVMLDRSPRTDICSECNKVGPFITGTNHKRRTCIRHDTIIDEQNPMKYTREVCPSCHFKLNMSRSKAHGKTY